jgi:hypothetical protein
VPIKRWPLQIISRSGSSRNVPRKGHRVLREKYAVAIRFNYRYVVNSGYELLLREMESSELIPTVEAVIYDQDK